MKKKNIMSKALVVATGFVALVAMSFTTEVPNMAIEQAAVMASERMLSAAVDEGYISQADKQTVLESGVVTEMAHTLVDSNFDVAVTVDRGAELAVEQGWFKNKTSAKKALRQACEKMRRSNDFAAQVYKLMGI